MKKNILFVIPSLSAGGGEKSLINLLSQIDYDLYNVDLFMFKHDGIFMEFLPKEVHVLPLLETYKIFTLSLPISIKKFLLKGEISLAYNRIMFTIKNRNKHISIREQYNWKYIARSLEGIEKIYDVAIGFLEKTSIYFCIDKVDAAKKIGWIHIDYDKLGMDPDFDIEYFRKLNNIITVSEECASVLESRFPSEKNKIKVIYNIVSPKIIQKLANEETIDIYDKKDDEVIILSIGRLDYQKGFELSIDACKKLVDKGYNIKWSIIGEGEERQKLTNMIKVNNLEENFKLLGLKSNPYPYINQADIYAQTSKFEGKSIAIDEAKILNKPIIVTAFSTARDQIKDGVDGQIVTMNSDAIVEGIERFIRDKNYKNNLVNNLFKEDYGTEDEINKLYKIL
ncbi:glycosyltransferase [Peribacillus psychrosaccharolyticus]|uniref:Glycosyltransferase n=2 Tax=Peribacillus psychrosaccharolyticus TaxID=1407 RepID=A0A974NR13_PERPY|nr:glycosyltransferase [Peribacillus psychrosaccharolyticus]MEC2056054.1 glycosyltransferase [Peribacillus psychrosaccharolyticus]MED3745495.1 glycosyltransferase [Peribacillus psychrosaccharolyticus]QQT02495.1 glycosyltransferase [Peribacillus psychrosaccharolyticus]